MGRLSVINITEVKSTTTSQENFHLLIWIWLLQMAYSTLGQSGKLILVTGLLSTGHLDSHV